MNRSSLPLLLALPALLACPRLAASAPEKAGLDEKSVAVFASAAKGRELLGRSDAFIARMSPFDRMVRMKSGEPVAEKELLAFIQKQVLDWTDAEKETLASALKTLKPKLSRLELELPATVYFVKTNGREEQGALAYTRDETVVFSAALEASGDLKRLLCHELFHVLSRRNPALRDDLYAAIGFEKCPDLELPAGLAKRKLTNPDAPVIQHRIRVEHGGEEVSAMPILFSKSATYDPEKGTTLFDYLVFKLLVVQRAADPRR